ncbi:MAG: tetratricopeptide repeat protein [Terriglobia bacterium]
MRRALAVVLWVLIFAGGASALRAGQNAAAEPLTENQIRGLVAGGVFSGRIEELVRKRGIDFQPTGDVLRSLQAAGAREALIDALRGAKVFPPPPAEAHAAAARDLSLAETFEREGLLDSAEREYRAALALAPEMISIHLGLAHVLRAERKRPAAIAQYRQAIRLKPNLAEAHQALAELLFDSGDVDGAVREYRAVVNLDPGGDHDAEARLAAILYSKGDLGGAISTYRDLETKSPRDASAHYRLGLALYANGQLEDAASELREALRLNAGFTAASATLGDVLLKQGDRLGALEQYRKSLAGQAPDPDVRAALDWLSRNLAQQHAP